MEVVAQVPQKTCRLRTGLFRYMEQADMRANWAYMCVTTKRASVCVRTRRMYYFGCASLEALASISVLYETTRDSLLATRVDGRRYAASWTLYVLCVNGKRFSGVCVCVHFKNET